MTDKIQRYLAARRPPTPCLVVDLDIVEENYRRLAAALPAAEIYYAVKANPARPVIERLDRLGSGFDTASIYEIEHCRALGIAPERMAYGSTVKKERDIAFLLDRASIGHALRGDPERAAVLDLVDAGGIEAGTQTIEPLDDRARRVGLHRVVDFGRGQRRRQPAVILLHDVEIDHQARGRRPPGCQITLDLVGHPMRPPPPPGRRGRR